MTKAAEFRNELRNRLKERENQVVLRISIPPRFDRPVELTGGDLLRQSEALAKKWCGADRGGVVLLLLPHSTELFLLHLGLILAERIPAILAWPTSRIDPEKYQRNLLHQLRNLPADQVITLPRLAANIRAGLPYQATGCPVETAAHYEKLFSVAIDIEPQGEPAVRSVESEPEALFLQFSGGTTGVQKSVVVTAPLLASQLDLLRESLDFSQKDGVVSWLPMYHDMGLIACLWFPLWYGAPSLQIGANDWVLNPELLFQHIQRYNGTFCWLPNFSFSYLAQRREQMSGRYDLSRVRAWINCSEPVRLRSMMSFVEAFADWGVRPESLQASYAMAENVFAVTQTELGRIPASVPRSAVRSSARSYQQLAFDLIDDVFVSSGKPLRDMEVRIANSNEACPEGTTGEILIRTPSLFSGYWGSQGFSRNSLTAEGFHATGDYGFIADGELFVIGRLKDIVIIGGQNIFPEDVEAVANSVPGVYPGRVVAFGIEDQEYGTESLAVIAEMKSEYSPAAATQLENEIRKLVLATIGIAPRYVAAVPQRWIVKSTAGKISRRDTRERFIREKLTRSEGA